MDKPLYYQLLADTEKAGYDALQLRMSGHDHRYNRNRRVATFCEMLDDIRQFCEGPDSARRYLACGICWADGFIATNTLHLRVILGKSKSSINGAFAKMGLGNSPGTDEECAQIAELIPSLRLRTQEIRQWTVRRDPSISSNCPTQSMEPPVASVTPSDSAFFTETEQSYFAPEPFEQFGLDSEFGLGGEFGLENWGEPDFFGEFCDGDGCQDREATARAAESAFAR
jgi:hypothetical protein